MNKKIIFLILLLFLMGNISAVELGIDKTSLKFNGSINTKICEKIKIYSDYNGDILGETRWSENPLKKISEYLIDESESGLEIEYNKKINLINSKEEKICISAKKPGNYYGALLYRTENKPAGVGLWITANIKDEDNLNDYSSDITGKVIEENSNSLDYEKILYAIPTIILFGTFLFLLKNYKKNRYKTVK